jgi:MFS family permease
VQRSWLPVAAVLLGTGWGANQFSPMLLVYSRQLGFSTGTLEAMFGVYALGLIPGLLLAGPLSDARGRRAVVVPAAALSLVATLVLISGAHAAAPLFIGRLLAGISSGAVFGAGTAWLRECSIAPFGAASDHDAARRAAVAMTTGFALGPLVAGLLAQWGPDPAVVPYLPHTGLMVGVLLAVRRAPETVTARSARRPVLVGFGDPRFRRRVWPMAPWVFAAPAIAFALLPSVVGADRTANGIALTALITAICAFSGVLVQPLGRRLDAGGEGRAARSGLLVLVAGLSLAALTAASEETWMLIPTAIVLGVAYGLCLVAGLVEIQRLAEPHAQGGLTAVYYALTYLGFGAPYLLAVAAHAASYAVLLAGAAALALATAGLVGRGVAPER